jgi:hypothetical protein
MHFLFSLLRIKGLYMFRALLAHPQEALDKRHLVYCVRVMSVGCYQGWSGTLVSLYWYTMMHGQQNITCTMFILYTYLPYFSYMFRCHVHHHHGKLLCRYLEPDIGIKLLNNVNTAVTSKILVHYKGKTCICCSYNSLTVKIAGVAALYCLLKKPW